MTFATVLSGESKWCVEHAACLDLLRTMPDACVDSVVTDPPAGIKFMGAEWDSNKGGRDRWIAWLTEIFVEIRRVAKPGAHAIVWALPKTAHWTTTAIENAGWEIRDVAVHLFGQGMPKSLNVSKAIDKAAGAKRPVVGSRVLTGNAAVSTKDKGGTYGVQVGTAPAKIVDVTAPATDDAKRWDGWGTGLKPASEHWILARAPIAKRSVVANVLAYGTGAINIDACRISGPDDGHSHWSGDDATDGGSQPGYDGGFTAGGSKAPLGRWPGRRWPGNVTMEHTSACVLMGTKKVRTGTAHRGNAGGLNFGSDTKKPQLEDMTYADADGMETIEAWECSPDCPVRLLDEQSGECPGMTGGGIHSIGYGRGMFGSIDSTRTARGDSGGASRFFYVAKPSTNEKERGCDHLKESEDDRGNTHTTVKSVELMRWHCKLVTPPQGVVLDPFLGSGTTAIAALADGFRCIGIEQDAEYVAIARGRIEGDMPLLNRRSA